MRKSIAIALGLASLTLGGPAFARPPEPFGITVSAPKVYEERALRLMLDEAEAQLAALRPIAATKFEGGIGATQGASQSSTSFTLTAEGLARPQVVTTETEMPDAETGELETTTLQTMTTEAATTPSAPEAPTQPALPTASYGLSARDLLSEQIALVYQIASLRLALERATSDRFNILPDGQAGTVKTRKPIVLGFTIGIDRPQRNQVAEVELTIDLQGKKWSGNKELVEDSDPPGISLVTVIPTKDAYNVAAITDSSANIGAGQIVSAFQIGAGYAWGRKTFYVVRDVDTVSITREPDLELPNRIKVAWQFRPVLGRKIIEPGPRQVFVVLAVDRDRYGDAAIETQAEMRWVKVGRHGVLRYQTEATGPTRLGRLSHWALFPDEIIKSYLYDPSITVVSDRQALVNARGYFLGEDSMIVVGDRVIDSSNGLSIRDDSEMSFMVPLVDLARADDVYLVNRHQEPIPLRRSRKAVMPTASATLEEENPDDSRATAPATAEQPSQENQLREAKPSFESFTCMAIADRERGVHIVQVTIIGSPKPNAEDLLAVAGETVVVGKASDKRTSEAGSPGQRGFRESPCRSVGGTPPTNCIQVVFDLPTEVIRKDPFPVVREIFGGRERSLRCALPVLPVIDRATLLHYTNDTAHIALQGRQLLKLESVRLGSREVQLEDPSYAVAVFEVEKENLEGLEVLVVTARPDPDSQQRETLLVPYPHKPEPKKVEVKKPTFEGSISVVQYFSGAVEVAGENLTSIDTVSFEGTDLKKSVSGKGLTVHLVSKVTERAAPRDLTVKLKDGSEVPLRVNVRSGT